MEKFWAVYGAGINTFCMFDSYLDAENYARHNSVIEKASKFFILEAIATAEQTTTIIELE